MNDHHLVERARGLRNTGLSYRDIGVQMNVSHTTIHNWLHPEHQHTITGLRSLLGKPETLTGTVIGTEIHARYRTGTRTLCGLDAPAHEPNHYILDCGTCSRTARAWDRIDGSMPNHWRTEAA